MSIIYDALQKTQKKRELKTKIIDPQMNTHKSRVTIRLAIMSALVVLTGFLSFSLFHLAPALSSHSQKNLAEENAKQANTIANNKLILQGIFTSDKHKIAMINNHMYHLGEMVNDMKIIGISQKTVKLRKWDTVLTLSSGY